MPLDSLPDLSELTSHELYSVYLAIARADHRWRLKMLYGDESPKQVHAPFRPLSIEAFHERLVAAQRFVGGESMLRERLARQAAAYGINVLDELAHLRQAA